MIQWTDYVLCASFLEILHSVTYSVTCSVGYTTVLQPNDDDDDDYWDSIRDDGWQSLSRPRQRLLYKNVSLLAVPH